MELLSLHGVTKVIKNRTIVNNVNLVVNKGEIVGFLGPNGAGKTTTIKMILSLFKKTKGTIKICGYDIDKDFEKAMTHVGAIVENPDLYKGLSGRENLEYFASFYDDSVKKNINTVVKLVKMENRIDDKIKTYSLGMRQRTGLAQSLLHAPPLLILDEPTNGLDPLGIRELRDLLKKITKEMNVGVLVSSHLLSEMELMCNRIYIIDNGVIISEQKVEEDNKIMKYEYSIDTNNNAMALKIMETLGIEVCIDNNLVSTIVAQDLIQDIINELNKNEIKIYAINRKNLTLEDKFMSITKESKGVI